MRIHYHEHNGSQSDGHSFSIREGAKILYRSHIFDSEQDRDTQARRHLAHMSKPGAQMKISKKNRELAGKIYTTTSGLESIALELQKRDDKIKALRAEVKHLIEALDWYKNLEATTHPDGSFAPGGCSLGHSEDE